MSEFFEMGGYASFVWPSFALTAIVMIGLAVQSVKELRAREAELARLEGEAPRGARRR